MWSGEYPYQDSPPANFAARVAYKGFRPTIPPACGPHWTSLILSCCTSLSSPPPLLFFLFPKRKIINIPCPIGKEPAERPAFQDIMQRLEEIREYMIREVMDRSSQISDLSAIGSPTNNGNSGKGGANRRGAAERREEMNDNGYFVLNKEGVLEAVQGGEGGGEGEDDGGRGAMSISEDESSGSAMSLSGGSGGGHLAHKYFGTSDEGEEY